MSSPESSDSDAPNSSSCEGGGPEQRNPSDAPHEPGATVRRPSAPDATPGGRPAPRSAEDATLTERELRANPTRALRPDRSEAETAIDRPQGAAGDGEAPAVGPPPETAGVPFGRYRLLEELGRGGMGVVWKAWDPQLRRTVALKQILVSGGVTEEHVTRFLREAQLAARLQHPNILPVLDVGEFEGNRYFTTTYLRARPLDRVFDDRPPLSTLVDWIHTIAGALDYAHGQGVVHRDIKPGNILVDDRQQVFVMDFGLAKDVHCGGSPLTPSRALTISGDLLGTPEYMSPEQAMGGAERAGPESDQFSLGAVLYEALTGQRPFQGATLRDLLNAIARADPPAPRRLDPRIPVDLEVICLRALEKAPAQRYPTIGEFAADLRRYREGEPILARPQPWLVSLARRCRRHQRILLPVCLTLAAVAATGILWGERVGREREALALLEQGRPGLEKAFHSLSRPDYDRDDLARRIAQARVPLEAAARLAPHLPVVHLQLGRAWFLAGEEARAEAAWRASIRCDASFGPARYHLGRLLLIRAFLLDLAGDREDAAPLRAASRELLREGAQELEYGWKAGGAGGSVEGEVFRPEEMLGAIRGLLAGEREQVRTLLENAVNRMSAAVGSEELWWILGCVEEGPGRVAAFEASLRARPRFGLALLGRGAARHASGDLAGAQADLDAALQDSPNLAPALFRRALVRFERGDRDGAAADLVAAAAHTASPALRQRAEQRLQALGR